MPELRLAGRAGRPIDGGQQQVLSDGQSLVPFWQVGVDELDQANLLGLIVERRDIAQAGNLRGLRLEGDFGALDGLDDIFERPEVVVLTILGRPSTRWQCRI